MNEFKNVKISIRVHELLVSRAKALGMKQFVLADTLLLMALAFPDQGIQEAVVNTQQDAKRPDSTTQE
jgi:hypothetical protein